MSSLSHTLKCQIFKLPGDFETFSEQWRVDITHKLEIYYSDKILYGLFMKLSRQVWGQAEVWGGLIIITIRLGEGEVQDMDSLLPGASIGRIICVDDI